jgi:hypothetical protein
MRESVSCRHKRVVPMPKRHKEPRFIARVTCAFAFVSEHAAALFFFLARGRGDCGMRWRCIAGNRARVFIADFRSKGRSRARGFRKPFFS